MRRTVPDRWASLRTAALLLAAGAAVTGCAASAGARQDQPSDQRAEQLKKLSPAEMQAAGDQAARAGEYDRAVNFYTQAIEVQPTADLWFRVGWIYNQMGKKPSAAQAFARTIELSPEHAGANEELGLLLLENKQREAAARHLERATELDPARWRSHNALGVLADARREHAAATAHYEAALAVVPASATVLNNLGYSHYLAGEFEQAEANYERALAAAPGDRAVLANLGLLRARQGNYRAALEVMGRVMDTAKAHNDVGYVAYQNGDLDEAEALLREAIRLSPSYYTTAHENLERVRSARESAEAADTGTVARRAD